MNETLCALFARALGLERFEPDDDFFARGGQSVTALLLLARVNEDFGACLVPSDLFEAPTPTRLARRLACAPPGPGLAAAEAEYEDEDEADDRGALSAAQEDLCSLDAGPETGAFGMSHLTVSSWRLTGPVDPLALQDALDDLEVRHEILRTEVDRRARPRCQRIRPAGQVRLSIRYLPGAASGSRREILAGLVAAEAGTEPFDVRDLPLLRATLVRLEPEDSLLVLVAHQSAVDGWSAQVLMRDLAACYEARRTRTRAQLPTVPSYRGYARESAPVHRRGRDDAELDFWRERLAGARIFGFAPRPPAEADPRGGRYGAYRFRVEARVASGVLRLAAETASTPFMVLLTAFCLLAGEQGAGEDLTVTAVGVGRDRARYPDTVGPFVNRLPIRANLAGARTFRQALVRVRAGCLAAYDHEVPFGRLAKAMPEVFDMSMESALTVPDFELLQSPLLGQIGKAAELGYAEEHGVPLVSEGDCPDPAEGMRWTLALVSTAECVGTLRYPREAFSREAAAELVGQYLRILRRYAGRR